MLFAKSCTGETSRDDQLVKSEVHLTRLQCFFFFFLFPLLRNHLKTSNPSSSMTNNRCIRSLVDFFPALLLGDLGDKDIKYLHMLKRSQAELIPIGLSRVITCRIWWSNHQGTQSFLVFQSITAQRQKLTIKVLKPLMICRSSNKSYYWTMWSSRIQDVKLLILSVCEAATVSAISRRTYRTYLL